MADLGRVYFECHPIPRRSGTQYKDRGSRQVRRSGSRPGCQYRPRHQLPEPWHPGYQMTKPPDPVPM